jgi:Xaa-Pro aminopeptidase
MVLDTGGQYWGATTDITRTIYLGDNPKNEIKNRYTRVLQGNMHLANGVFPNNTPGRDRQN